MVLEHSTDHAFNSDTSRDSATVALTSKPPYFCEHCERNFSDPSNLQRHIRSAHVGARSHACIECGKTFATSSGLKQHQHIHSSVKPFQCEVCLRAYTQFSNLCRHKRMHADCRRQIRCKECGQNFSTATSLGKHRRFCTGTIVAKDLSSPQQHLSNNCDTRDGQIKVEPTNVSKLFGRHQLASAGYQPASESIHSTPTAISRPSVQDVKLFPRNEPAESTLFTEWAPIIASMSPTFFDRGCAGIHSSFPAIPPFRARESIFCPPPAYSPYYSMLAAPKDAYGESVFRYAEHLVAMRNKEYEQYQKIKTELNLSWSRNKDLNGDKHKGDLESSSRLSDESGNCSDRSPISLQYNDSAMSDEEELKSEDEESYSASNTIRSSIHEENDTCAASSKSSFVKKEEVQANNIRDSGSVDNCRVGNFIDTLVSIDNSLPLDQPLDLSTKSFVFESQDSPSTNSSINGLKYQDSKSLTLHDILLKPSGLNRSQLAVDSNTFPKKSPANSNDSEKKRGERSGSSKTLDKNSAFIDVSLAAGAMPSPKATVPTASCTVLPTYARSPQEHKQDAQVLPQRMAPENDAAGCAREKYKCRFCGKLFPRSANLTRHLRTHTGEQPYHCSHCDRSFSISSNLQRHVRNIHRREKPFKCRFCARTFGQQTNLDRHLRRHVTDERSLDDGGESISSTNMSPSSDETMREETSPDVAENFRESIIDDIDVDDDVRSLDSDSACSDVTSEEVEMSGGESDGNEDDLSKFETSLPITTQVNKQRKERIPSTQPVSVPQHLNEKDYGNGPFDDSDEEVKRLTSRSKYQPTSSC